jgi:hypothetical protein
VEEKEIKKMGEELSKVAVESKLGAKQLRTIYTLTKTKPLPLVEAHIQHQLGRGLSGVDALKMSLDYLRKLVEDKATFQKVLMYANMLYPYYEAQAAMKYRVAAEEGARKMCERQGCRYLGLDVSSERGQVVVRVKVSGLRGEPKFLASDIEREIIQNDPKFPGRVWIEQVDRR